MNTKKLLGILLIVFTGFSSYGKTIAVDAPINENIRFFRIPDSNKAIAFNFENGEYEVLRYNNACGYSSCSSIGMFTLGIDSIIFLDKESDYSSMLIGFNDGTDTPLKFEGFDSRDNKPLPFSYININYEQEPESRTALWNVFYESNPMPCVITHSGLPETIEIRTHSNYIMIDLREPGRLENSVEYYPVYLFQGKPINKLVLYTDLDSFGARNRKYIICDGEVYLIGLHSRRKLEELFPGQNCGEGSNLQFFITGRWDIDFIDPNHVQTISVKEVF